MTVLVSPQYAATNYVLFTNPGNTDFVIDAAGAHNSDTVVRRIYMHLVPSGGTPDSSNIFIDIAVQPKETYQCAEIAGHELSIGMAVAIKAETALNMAIVVTGRQR